VTTIAKLTVGDVQVEVSRVERQKTPSDLSLVRDEVREFAADMEGVLRENEHKGGWDGLKFAELLEKLREEVEELASAMHTASSSKYFIIHEAADVANYAMMIADTARRRPA